MNIKTINLTNDGDFEIVDNQLIDISDFSNKNIAVADKYNLTGWQIIDGIDALRQRLKNRLKLFKGEWFLDEEAGLNWFQLFENPVSFRRIKSKIRDILEEDELVDEVKTIEIEPDFKNRKIKIMISIKAYGEIINVIEEKR